MSKKRKVLLLISLVLVGLVFMVVGCTPRTNNLPSAVAEIIIEQATPTPGNITELSVENEVVAQGIIIGEVYFDGIPISRFFKEPFVDILGEPTSVRGNFSYYDNLGLEVEMTSAFNALGMFEIVQSMVIDTLHLVRVNGISLDSNREDLITLLGNPVEYYEYLRYHIFSPTIAYILILSLEEDGTVRDIVILSYDDF